MGAQVAHGGVNDGLVRVGSFAAVPAVLRQLGFDPATVLAGAGFSAHHFDSPDNRVSIAARSRLIAHCAEVTRCEHFGLLVGQHNGLHALGLIGLLARYSVDVQSAISNLIQYFHVHVRGASIRLTVSQDIAMLSYQLHQPEAVAQEHISDAAVAWLLNILHELSGHREKPVKVLLNHRQPRDVEPFHQFFRSPVQFNALHSAVTFPAAWLRKTLPSDHVDVRRLIQDQVDQAAARTGDDFVEKVRALLRDALLNGFADEGRLSTLLTLHPRTLRRRLNAVGSGYQQLLDDVRLEMAEQLLGESERSVAEIAQMLQYSDARSFIRAFRRWTGRTPTRWRSGRGNRASLLELDSDKTTV